MEARKQYREFWYPEAQLAHSSMLGCCYLLTGHQGFFTLLITAVGHAVCWLQPPVPPCSSPLHPFLPFTSHLSSLSAAAHHQPDICWGGGEAGGA